MASIPPPPGDGPPPGGHPHKTRQSSRTREDRDNLVKLGNRRKSSTKKCTTAESGLVKVLQDKCVNMLLPLLEEACPEVLIALREAGIPEKEWLAPKAPGYRQELFDALEADDRIAWYLWAGPFDAVTAASVERWSHHGYLTLSKDSLRIILEIYADELQKRPPADSKKPRRKQATAKIRVRGIATRGTQPGAALLRLSSVT